MKEQVSDEVSDNDSSGESLDSELSNDGSSDESSDSDTVNDIKINKMKLAFHLMKVNCQKGNVVIVIKLKVIIATVETTNHSIPFATDYGKMIVAQSTIICSISMMTLTVIQKVNWIPSPPFW